MFVLYHKQDFRYSGKYKGTIILLLLQSNLNYLNLGYPDLSVK